MNRYLPARSGLITALFLACLAGLAALAVAVPTVFGVSFSLGDTLNGGGPGTTPPNSAWDTDYDDYACNSSLSGSTINDAELDPDDETAIGTQGDAFDDGLQVVVDGAAFDDADDSGDLTTDSTGEALALGPEAMSGLNVSLEWKALSAVAKMRTFVTFENPTGSDIAVPISWETNLGSDDTTGVRGSSGGDTTFGTDDRWLVTSDDPDTPGDPVNTFVLFGPGSPAVTPTSVSQNLDECITDEGVIVGYDITVPAGETRYLLFFNLLSQTNEDALADAPGQFDANPAFDSDLISGLDPAALPLVLNWDIPVVDLAITKTTDATSVEVGDQVTYTVSVTNNGPAVANATTVTDDLPDATTFVSATPSQGTCDEASGVVTCDLGDMPVEGTATIDIVVTVTAQGSLQNSASVSAHESDSDPSNDTAVADVTAAAAPAATPTPTPTPAQLPTTGGQPGSSSGLAWLALAIGGIAALAGGAVLTRRFARTRR